MDQSLRDLDHFPRNMDQNRRDMDRFPRNMDQNRRDMDQDEATPHSVDDAMPLGAQHPRAFVEALPYIHGSGGILVIPSVERGASKRQESTGRHMGKCPPLTTVPATNDH
jgi:hypothetical protein